MTIKQFLHTRSSQLFGIVAVVGCLALAVSAFICQPPDTSVGTVDQPRIDFGYGRESLTRTFTYQLCASKDAQKYQECKANVDTLIARPDITSATLATDLMPADETEVNKDCRKKAGRAFPAQQIKVSAANFDLQGFAISVTADPLNPEEVPAGAYCGTLLITRASGGTTVELPLIVDLDNRWAGAIIWRVFISLFLGAAVGALLKWIGDHIGKPEPAKPDVGALGGTLQHWFAKHPGLVLGGVTAITVTITGASSQYIADPTFNNSFLDYFGLILWAFTGQLAGQTLIDVAGNTKAAMAKAQE